MRIGLFSITLLLCAGCATVDEWTTAPPHVVTTGHSSNLVAGTGKAVALRIGEPYSAPLTSSVLVESSQKVSLLLLPSEPAPEAFSLRNLAGYSDTMTPFLEARLDKTLDNAISGFESLSDRKPEEALAAVRKAQQGNPKVPQLSVLEAQCLIALGKKKEAIGILTQVLNTQPTNAQALRLGQAIDWAPPKAPGTKN